MIGSIVCFKDSIPIRMFKYGFEINEFVGSKDAYSNVSKVLDGKRANSAYKYNWRLLKDCEKEVQDIVEAHYESLGK